MGLGGIEPPTSALSVLATGTGVNGVVLTGTRLEGEGPPRTGLNCLARAIRRAMGESICATAATLNRTSEVAHASLVWVSVAAPDS